MNKLELAKVRVVLLYTVLGHPEILLRGFETKAGAIMFAHKMDEVTSFCVVEADHFLHRAEDNQWVFEK